MTTPETAQSNTPTPKRDADDRSAPKREVNQVSIQELFRAITLKKLMDNEVPGSADLATLKDIELGLESPDLELKAEATKRFQEVAAAKDVVEAGAIKVETVEDLLNAAKIPDAKKEKLKSLADDIDHVFAKSRNETLSDTELERVNSELLVLASEIGIKENAEGMEEALAKMKWLEASKAARQFVKERELYMNPVEEYIDEFRDGQEGKVLKLTDVPAHEKDSKQNKLDVFKKHVAKELVAADKRVIEDLSQDDLVNRLKEVTYWQANMGDLQGRKKWAGNKNIEQIRDVLGRVEAQYQALLEDRMVKDLTTKHGEDKLQKNLIRESVVKTLRDRRRFLRSEYDFDKGVPSGKRPAEVLEDEVYQGAKKFQEVEARRSSAGSSGGGRRVVFDEEGGRYVPAEDELTLEESQRRNQSILEMQEKSAKVARKLGIDPGINKTLRKSATFREEMLKKAQDTLSTDEMKTYSHMHAVWEKSSGGMRGELSEIQDELESLKGSRQYSKFIIKFKAYVERVGLREASSDWDFAIMMREAKEEISRIHPDAGEKLDQWQEALFAPGLATLDEKSFFEVMPKIMSQSRLEHEFGTEYANWEAMQVVGADGTKKVISVASFYQLLQREDVAKRILKAKTNGNDGELQAILVEHVWGPGAKLDTSPRVSHGLTPKMRIIFDDPNRAPINDISVNYFSLQDGRFEEGQGESLQIEDFIDQSMWMTHYAKTIWHYSGEWEPFLRDFPTDQLTQANKRLIAIGSAFRDYGLDYGKFDVGYAELAKAGVLLQPFATYKIGDVIKANIRHLLYDKGITDAKKGDKIGGALMDAVQKRAFISDKYTPVIGMRSVDEMRLMGRISTGFTPGDKMAREELGWEMFKKNQEVLGRKGVLDLGEARKLRTKYLNNEKLSEVEEGWAVQLIEIGTLMDDLANQRKLLGEAGFTDAILKQLMDKQSLLTTGEPYNGPVSLDEYLKRFEYTSVIEHAQLKKGTDPLDYKKYSEAKAEAAKLMTDVLSGSPTLDNINQLYNTMKGYMPPEQLMAWFEEYTRTRVRLRTNQMVGYEIAMTDLEVWKMLKARGEDVGSRPLGINPYTYKIKDERGDSWNVIGADGFKVTKKKMERGNHMYKTREIPGLTAKQIETEMKLYVGNRWLPNKETGHHIVEDSFGLSQAINRYYKNIGRPELADKGLPKFIKKWGSKAVILLRQHPLFDDPTWAFWSILNEFYEYSQEVGKEMQKSVVGGH